MLTCGSKKFISTIPKESTTFFEVNILAHFLVFLLERTRSQIYRLHGFVSNHAKYVIL